MRRFLLPLLAGVALASCGEQTEAPVAAPTAADPAPAPATPVAQLTPEQSCREAVRILYGQEGDAVTFDKDDFSISWPAPVDGGRLAFACSFAGSQVSLTRDGKRQTIDISSPASTPVLQEAR